MASVMSGETLASLAERGFRVEGLFRLSLESENARRLQAYGRLDKVVAGEGFEPPTHRPPT